MNNTNEMLDAILSEMREQANEPTIESLGEVIPPIGPDDVKDWADRLEAAVDRMRDAYCDLCKEKDEAYDRLLLERDKAIKASASGNVATPPCKGRWMNGRSYEYEYAYCSECGRMQWAGWDTHKQAEENIKSFADDYRFCPGCGAKMEGGEYVK